MKKKIAAIILLAAVLTLTGCTSAAEEASKNLSTAADNFEIERKITFYNGITGEFMLTIEGYCSIDDDGNQLEVTCKVDDNEYTKDFLGLSDNVTYISQQTETADVSLYHRRVLIRPETILPEIEFDTGKQ
jgi:ABC-type Fe3+-hydroxamate transport system substrate-binding protein